MAVDAPTRALLDQYRLAGDELGAAFEDIIRHAWGQVPYYNDDGIALFADTITPVAEAAQAQMGALTDAHLAQLEAVELDLRTRPVGVPATVTRTEALRGGEVTAADVWRRPGLTVWTDLSRGTPPAEAIEHGLSRALQIGRTNLQLARTHSAHHVLSRRQRVQGYRRVPRGGSSCALCLLASTQRYRKGDLMPIHPGCDCGIDPVYGHDDPGPVLEPDQLDAIHQAIEDFTGQRALSGDGYRHYVVEHHHGEIGPVMSMRGQHFTGPKEIP
jgi:hypothetical protein